MILADENVDFRLIHALRNAGFDVISIYETYRGISDKEIIEISKNTHYIILTEDKDFGEWVFAHQENTISVVFLRYTYQDLAFITEIVLELFRSKGTGLFGKFTTVTRHKIRIRTFF
jgi:predicted nuclease of predicted toxin-antitoxin system